MIYTIGFTQSTAQQFFERLRANGIDILLDIRLNNRSQLAGFAKYPDIAWFLRELCGITYLYDDLLAPTAELLDDYRKKKIDWDGYEACFERLMRERDIPKHIREQYGAYETKAICLLCSEHKADRCHRRLVAEAFANVFGTKIAHL